MTRKTFQVIESNALIYRLVGIMTRQTADSSIVAGKAFAVLQPVRLKANIRRPVPMVPHRGVPRTMALPAKLRRIRRIHLLQCLGPRTEISTPRI